MIDNSCMNDAHFFELQERYYEEQLAIHEREESIYDSIFTTLLMSGEYKEHEIDAQVHEIMDNPGLYPEYF